MYQPTFSFFFFLSPKTKKTTIQQPCLNTLLIDISLSLSLSLTHTQDLSGKIYCALCGTAERGAHDLMKHNSFYARFPHLTAYVTESPHLRDAVFGIFARFLRHIPSGKIFLNEQTTTNHNDSIDNNKAANCMHATQQSARQTVCLKGIIIAYSVVDRVEAMMMIDTRSCKGCTKRQWAALSMKRPSPAVQ